MSSPATDQSRDVCRAHVSQRRQKLALARRAEERGTLEEPADVFLAGLDSERCQIDAARRSDLLFQIIRIEVRTDELSRNHRFDGALSRTVRTREHPQECPCSTEGAPGYGLGSDSGKAPASSWFAFLRTRISASIVIASGVSTHSGISASLCSHA